MSLNEGRYVADLEKMMYDFLQGKSLQAWCDEISELFLTQTQQTNPPFSVIKFLPYRKIKAEHDTSISVSGKIETTKNGFLLKLNPDKLKTKKYYNYVLAHEVGHTFFYDISNNEPIDISGLPNSSKYLEYLCNRIARYLVIPSISIKHELFKIPSIHSVDFNLNYVNKLLGKYDTFPNIFFPRVFIDEPIWDALFLQFKYFESTKSWKLFENYKPNKYDSIDFFIPRSDKFKADDNPNKYPSVVGNLDLTIRKIHLELIETKRLSLKVKILDLKSEPLNTFFSNFDIHFEVLIHTSLYKEKEILNMLIPLGNDFILSKINK